VCVGGACVSGCPALQTECNSLCVSLKTSALNCGACGNKCPTGQVCVNGACATSCPGNEVPAPTFGDEGPTTSCVLLESNSNNCGAIGALCTSGAACADDTCSQVCPASANCLGSCTDLSSDPNHCGSCTTACGVAQVCVNGACTSTCPAGTTACGR